MNKSFNNIRIPTKDGAQNKKKERVGTAVERKPQFLRKVPAKMNNSSADFFKPNQLELTQDYTGKREMVMTPEK